MRQGCVPLRSSCPGSLRRWWPGGKFGPPWRPSPGPGAKPATSASMSRIPAKWRRPWNPRARTGFRPGSSSGCAVVGCNSAGDGGRCFPPSLSDAPCGKLLFLALHLALGIQGLAASGSWTLLMRADRGVWEAFHAMVKSSAWGSSLFQVGRPDSGDHSSTFFGIFMPVSSGAHAASEPSGGERRAGFGCLRGSVRPQYGQRESRRMILR
jgi:hypothetical protein